MDKYNASEQAYKNGYSAGYEAGRRSVGRKSGRWVKKTEDFVYYYACSECGEPVLKSQWGHDFFSDYCPNCGADMRGEEDG